jgi:hypothetical protein
MKTKKCNKNQVQFEFEKLEKEYCSIPVYYRICSGINCRLEFVEYTFFPAIAEEIYLEDIKESVFKTETFLYKKYKTTKKTVVNDDDTMSLNSSNFRYQAFDLVCLCN